jgi:hypothetical protein
VRFAPVKAALAAWYRLSLLGLALIVKSAPTGQIKAIYTRHQNWILGISDVDLIIFYNDRDPARDRRLYTCFWRRYIALRRLFPMLCGVSEIRWIPLARLHEHPLHFQSETHLLITPEQWNCVFRRAGETGLASSVFNPPQKRHLPFTMFLEFNLYGYIQHQLFSNEHQPKLRFERMAKCAVKILQHFHYLQTGQYVNARLFQQNLHDPEAGQPWQHYADMMRGLLASGLDRVAADRELARSIFTIVAGLSRAHESLMDGEPPGADPVHAMPGEWQGSGLGKFLGDAEQRFAGTLTLVAFQSPYKQYHTRLFLAISPEMSFEDFYSFVLFARQYHEVFLEERVLLSATTPVLLTSQFYSLWGHVALEGHMLQAQEVYAPRGGLRFLPPKEEWTLQKIRESVAVFEEFYLPFMMSPLAKGDGMDFCKIYERAETEMLFHYYCYLKDKDGYLDLIQRCGNSADEVIAYGCAHYGNEIGIQNWHPTRFIDSYPYLKTMIRRVDEMALKRLELASYEIQYST